MAKQALNTFVPNQQEQVQYVRDVRRVTWAGLAVNLALFVLKLIGGVLGSSQAVVADAVHTLSDASTDVAILVGVGFWSKPPDANHPHGHRRIETLITTAIAVALTLVGIALIFRALTHLHNRQASAPGWIAFGAAALSIVTKEGLYRWTLSTGQRINSTAVIANAWHHRSDAVSSLPAALAVAGAAVNPAWSFLDPVGAVIVSLFIFYAAWGIGRPAVGQLVDAGAPPEDRESIRRIAMDTEGVQDVHAIRTRYIGTGLQVDLHVKVDPELTVRVGHDISEDVKRRLLDHGPDVVDVVVHLEPYEGC